MERQEPVGVLFVCMGNICRSPMAEAIFRRQVADAGLDGRFLIDSAGTGSWHVGEPPHLGTLTVLARRGIDPGDRRARQITRHDFDRFDYIVAMDHENLAALERFRRDGRAQVSLLLSHAPGLNVREVPDPYYTGGFDRVFDLVEAGCRGLLAHIREREGML
ncbi:MAG: low molecular weight protein-tyrosine-phosphatase [Oscillochloridaceae bacterium]|nr:low molecular weight phosphotyrosine protein phosphatase [Chloroflexaceae bacterium]MDW8392206.1 low molecular weight protein-tyrosine-phosphatase [Oscillochloridaceae bacterium]